jgi:hypothetical protein
MLFCRGETLQQGFLVLGKDLIERRQECVLFLHHAGVCDDRAKQSRRLGELFTGHVRFIGTENANGQARPGKRMSIDHIVVKA